MKWILDTDICIYWLKGNQKIEQMAMKVGLDSICVSFITISELYYGAFKSEKVQENLALVGKLQERLTIVESDSNICSNFGRLKAHLEKKGTIIDDADLFIAASALTTKSVLVTNNEKHFDRIEKLKLENWSKVDS